MSENNWILRTFGRTGAVVGVIHLPPLPGSPLSSRTFEDVAALALKEAAQYSDCGFDGVIIENHGDAPFEKDSVGPSTTAMMAVISSRMAQEVSIPIGINILRNASLDSLAAASASGAAFIRVNVLCGVTATDQGLIEGRGAELLRERRNLGSAVAICADIDVKYGVPLYHAAIGDLARSTFERGGADALIVSGKATGAPANLEEVAEVKAAVPTAAVLVGSGVTAKTVRATLQTADGVIVGSCCRANNRIDGPLAQGAMHDLIAAAESSR